MSKPENTAVFLSYASQDAAAARRICEALRAAGVEVWFDQNELLRAWRVTRAAHERRPPIAHVERPSGSCETWQHGGAAT